MRCHYEVLGLEMECEQASIKTAYFKLAMKWHPDKNIGNEAEAEMKFKEINEAYEILSDPQERAWYDSHRDQILRGGDGTEGDFDSGFNVWPYFSRSCFQGFGDNEGGFYKIYAFVFKNLNDEDMQAATEKNPYSLPPFGHSGSDWKDVNSFYLSWCDFASRKSFSWADKYKTSDGPNRQIRRIIEKENKKERDKIKKAYNELVRRLVKQVKMSDPRVKAQLILQQQKAEEKAKQDELDKIQKAERLKELREQQKKQWEEEAKQKEEEEGEGEGGSHESSQESINLPLHNTNTDY